MAIVVSKCKCVDDGQPCQEIAEYMNTAADSSQLPFTALIFCAVLVAVVIIVIKAVWNLALAPRWRVWAAHQAGLADLTRAKNEQKIQVAEAQGRVDAAQLNKQAAVIEAEGVALQIQAIGEKLTCHDLYLRWQWIKMMEDNGSSASVVYVPTEANLPILEAQRRT